MATEKVGIYRKYHGPIPTDRNGKPLPKSEWPRKRAFRWAVRWFGSDGNRYSKSFRTRKEAERFAETKQSDIRSGKADPPPGITFEEFLSEHERVMCGQVASATLYDQMRALKMFMAHIGKNLRLIKISPRHAESFVAARLASKVKVSTVNKDIRTLKRVFGLAIAPRGYLPAGQNPFASIKQRKVSLKPVPYVDTEEFQAVLASAMSTWWKTLLTLAYTSGGRRDELLNLTWADIDFNKRNVRFFPKEASGSLLAWEPKDHEGRIVPIPDDTIQLLADLQSTASELSPYVFISEKRLVHILSRRHKGNWKQDNDLVNNLTRNLKVMCTRAGVKSFGLHDLRRSCITNWAQVLPVHVVQKLAGHSDIKTTQQYYLAIRQSDLEAARQIQSRVLGTDLTDPKLTHFGKNDGIQGNGKRSG
jgi:integrase